MSEPADAAKPHIPATVIPQLAAAAAQIAATHAEPSPASIAAVATTRAKALDVVGKGTKIPGSESVPVYAVVMTGHFISHRGGPPSPRQRPPLTGSTLAVILDARTLTLMDLGLSDNDDTALLPALGPLITLKAQ